MSSTNVDSEQPEQPLSIQEIIKRIRDLVKELASKHEAMADSPQKATIDTNTAANNQIGNGQDSSNTAVNGQETKNTESNKKQEDSGKKNSDESDKRKEVLHELGKLRKELDYMIRSFQKLETFENSLREPLKTLEANVKDIAKDLPLDKADKSPPKQLSVNLRVLRNNITRVKILIPSQHQTANTKSEGNRALQTTIATGEAEELPYLFGADIFEKSYYFKEIKDKYESLNIRQKLCMFCFAIFPENAQIKKRLLRFWWVGENLVLPEEGKDEMGIVTDTIDKFVEKGLIDPVLKKNKLQPRSYKMNPIVRSCVIKFAKGESFFDYDQEGKPTMDFSSCKKACMVKSEGATAPWFSEYLKGREPEKLKAEEAETEEQIHKESEQGKLSADLVKLQMLFNFPDRKILEKASEQLGELQTLFNISKQFPALPTGWFSKMTGLQVLYLGKWESTAGRPRHIEVEDIEFLKGLKNMKKLRLLSFQGISGIPKLPGTICKLENLRILDLRACHDLEKLPDRIGSLKKLTYLDFSECYLLDDMPKQLNQLWELQVLKGFVIGNGKNSCTLKDLSELKNLRKLSVNVNTTKFDIDDAGEDLSKFQKLQKLKITWGSKGLTGKDSTQDSREEQSKSKKDQQASNTAGKSWTEKEQKGEDKDNRESSATCEADSRTTNQEDDKKKQKAGGATKSMASNVVNEQDRSRKPKDFKWAASMVSNVNKLTSLGRGKRAQNLKGLENLVKLDLQCFPRSTPPRWLLPTKMVRLRNLSIRGGGLGHLIHEREMKWNVDTLHLKFLVDFKTDWKEIRERFPNLKYLEIVRSPRITFCPCDASGVWQSSSE